MAPATRPRCGVRLLLIRVVACLTLLPVASRGQAVVEENWSARGKLFMHGRSGNLGVGDEAVFNARMPPSKRLDVHGDARVRGSLLFTRPLETPPGASANLSIVVPASDPTALTLRDSAGHTYLGIDTVAAELKIHAPVAFGGDGALTAAAGLRLSAARGLTLAGGGDATSTAGGGAGVRVIAGGTAWAPFTVEQRAADAGALPGGRPFAAPQPPRISIATSGSVALTPAPGEALYLAASPRPATAAATCAESDTGDDASTGFESVIALGGGYAVLRRPLCHSMGGDAAAVTVRLRPGGAATARVTATGRWPEGMPGLFTAEWALMHPGEGGGEGAMLLRSEGRVGPRSGQHGRRKWVATAVEVPLAPGEGSGGARAYVLGVRAVGCAGLGAINASAVITLEGEFDVL